MRAKPALLIMVALSGCVHLPAGADRASVYQRIENRTGQPISPEASPDKLILPAIAEPDQKWSEEQVVLIALWNNPTFHELLTDLRITKSDLVTANLLPNPEFVYYFQEPDKPFKYLFDLPIEAIWLRPIRLKIAGQENLRAAERLTQTALDLIRDTRQAYADLLLARERLRIAQEAAKLRGRISDLAKKRLDAGDASDQEAGAARIDSLQATQAATQIGYEVPLAEERLRNLLGLGGEPIPLAIGQTALPGFPIGNIDDLANEAVQTRPDVISAEHFEAAAAERLRFAKIGWVRLLGLGDATSGRDSHVLGPAFRFTVPIFNRNQGGIARAEAELEQAQRRRVTVRNQVQLEVRQAFLRYSQAQAEYQLLHEKVRPEVEAAIRRAEKAYNDGGAPYLIVLETTRQLFDAYYREAQLQTDLRRAWADLERSVGRRLSQPSPPKEPSP